MGQEDGHLTRAQRRTQLLDLAARVAEDEPLLSSVQRRDEFGGVVEGADVVELHFARRPVGRLGDRFVTASAAVGGRQVHSRGDDLTFAAADARALQPVQQLGRVADGR